MIGVKYKIWLLLIKAIVLLETFQFKSKLLESK